MTASEAFYKSWGHQPIQFWILQATFLVWLLRQRRTNDRMWLVVFTLTSALDGWLTSDRVMGLGVLAPGAAQWLAIFFVIVGDLRLFWFMFPRQKLAAIGLAFVTPVLSALFRTIPGFPVENLRAIFISYEIIFVVLLAVLWIRSTKHARKIAAFAAAYYVFWILADALLLRGVSGGLLEFAWSLRLTANLLYYGGLLPWVALNSTEDKYHRP